MQEYWESYMKPMEGHAASVAFNVAVSDGAVSEEYPYMGFVKVFLQDPDEQGLLKKSELEEVSYLGDNIEMEALRYRIGKYVGRIFTQGSVSFIYYLKQEFEWKDAVSNAMWKFSDYEYEFGSRPDVEWEVYRKLLYPNPKEWQMIHNRHTCQMLKNAGDNLRIKRAIEHKCYFKDSDNRELYKKFLELNGFKIQKETEPEEPLKLHGLQFYRQDSPFYYDIDELTFWLIDSSGEHGGEYDGWETSVVKV